MGQGEGRGMMRGDGMTGPSKRKKQRERSGEKI